MVRATRGAGWKPAPQPVTDRPPGAHAGETALVTSRLAYSSNAYMRFGVEEAIARIAALGYRGIELMADAPHLWPAETASRKIDAVRAALDRHGLAISNVNAFMMNRIADKRQPYWHPSWIE